jgi:ubiquinone/menaquinone biosynthesis C-methylase UbiE
MNPTNPRENTSTYFINPEEAAETERLLLQDRSVTQAMGGLLPTSLDAQQIHTVLDLACGPGGWALEVARTYPHIEVVGVDISEKMIRYVQVQARLGGLDNASFQVMNILDPLSFPEDAFDLVNARLISSFVPVRTWPSLLQECKRITSPGGTIRITEAEWSFTNGKGCEEFAARLTHAMWLDGKSFSPDGRRMGATLALGRLFRENGLTDIERHAYSLEYSFGTRHAYSLEYSFGTKNHEIWYQNTMTAYPLLLPFLLKMGVITQEEFEHLYTQIDQEMQEPDFLGEFFLLGVFGRKPK